MRYFCIISWSFLPSSHYFYKYAELGFFHDYFCPFSSTGEIIYLLFKVVPSWRGKEVIGVCDTSKCEQKGMNKIWKNMFNKPYNSMLKKKKQEKVCSVLQGMERESSTKIIFSYRNVRKNTNSHMRFIKISIYSVEVKKY